MSTLLALIGIFALIIFGKFIYDSYLTDNTARDWNEYKANEPTKAKIIEDNQGLNFKTEHKLKKNGVYISKFKGVNSDNEFYECTFIITFNDNERVFFDSVDGLQDVQKSGISRMLESISGVTEDEKCTKYFIEEGKINFAFYRTNSNQKKGEEFSGLILEKGMLLTFDRLFYNYKIREYDKETIFKELKFDYIKA